jgi:hypothetical protein
MPDMEDLTDQLRIDMAKIWHKAKGKNADFWEGYRAGKSRARWEVLAVVVVLYFGIAMIGKLAGA